MQPIITPHTHIMWSLLANFLTLLAFVVYKLAA